MISRWGRRCVAEDSPVQLYNGTTIKIQDIKVGYKVASWSFNKQKAVPGNVSEVFNNGIQDIFEVLLENDLIIKCTSNHPILILRNTTYLYKQIDRDLSINDMCVILNKDHTFSTSRIVDITYIGKKQTYDITVDNYSNFSCNFIICHNSGKSVTFCADTLWWAQAYPLVRMIETKAIKQKSFRVLVFCPYESQIKELWNTYTQLIGDSPLLMDQLVKIRTSDIHLIEFKGTDDSTRGSTIEGFTIGISSSNQGTSLRGLCLGENTRISMIDGSTKNIKDLNINDKIISYNINSKSFVEDSIAYIADEEEKELFEIEFQSGRKIQSSKDHKFLTDNGWKKLEDITLFDKIKSSFNFVTNSVTNPQDEYVKICAYLIGDGCISDNRIKNSTIPFTNTNKKLIDDYKNCLKTLGFYFSEQRKKEWVNKQPIDIVVTGFKRKQPKFYQFLKDYELLGKIHNTKSVPDIIKKSSTLKKALFLRHLFSTDGWCSLYISKQNYNQCEIGYCSTSFKLCQDIHDILYQFGIYSKIQTKYYYVNNIKFIKYELKIRSKTNIKTFFQKIGYIFGKENSCKIVDNIVSVGVHADKINPEYEKIISIKSIGLKKCYDITTKKYHNFIANGVITHNSGDMVFIDEMDYIPSDIMEQVILPITTTHVDVRLRICSTPSGKREKFFHFCSDSKQLGWFHTHIQSWHPDNTNWRSIEQARKLGIPIEESTEFQVRHSTTTSAFEREYGAEFGEEFGGVYKHTLINKSITKYNRNIDTRDLDVFDPGFEQNPEHKYIVGVDWNSYVNGGQVVMVEYCSTPTLHTFYDDDRQEDVIVDFTGKYRLFYRRSIKSQESTQRMTRNEVIRLMTYYKVDYVYVDYGAGDTNIEELSLYGRGHPELKLSEKLVVIDSGAVAEHYDHIIGKKVKKRNKTLMVNFSVISLEEGMFLLPKEEDQDTRLVGQMRSYVVKNITARGEYSYEGDDHILDAFNLAIYGFQQKFGQLMASRIKYDINITADPRMQYFPKRAGNITTPIPIKIKNSYSTPIRDPEKPLAYPHKNNRSAFPLVGAGRSLHFNTRRGSF
ncbi:MAG: hypothetical protein M0R17_05420 [Candidatus Omnitrophica bacterium]|nr:hypothetical protein [Candidatus Omnitrophota bacterium]